MEERPLQWGSDRRARATSGVRRGRPTPTQGQLSRPDLGGGTLDSASSEKLWTLLEEVARDEGITVVMVTHEPSAAVHCEHVFVLSDGRVVGGFEVEDDDAARVAARYSELAG